MRRPSGNQEPPHGCPYGWLVSRRSLVPTASWSVHRFHTVAVRLGAHERQRPAVGRPARDRRKPFAADPADMLAVAVGDVHPANAVTIRVERDPAAVGRRSDVEVVRGVVNDFRDAEHGAIAVRVRANEGRPLGLVVVIEHRRSRPTRTTAKDACRSDAS